ncbi:MAG: cyclodeaminase/cyclohydrolase family protein [Candidatus Omnitrophica bacterium]|nr:cyclodeaminase/cyclohydrolase family protein [Candidatus Omnitrophota bacterium]
MPQFAKYTIQKYLKELASDKPIPGGGSAAALSASLGAGLALMVAYFSVRRQKTDESKKKLKELTRALEKTMREMTRIIDEDAEVFTKVSKCYSLSRKAQTEGQKRIACMRMDQALTGAFQTQAKLALLIVMALRVRSELAPLASGSVTNDLHVSQSLLRGAFEGAISTCNINAAYVSDEKKKSDLTGEMDRLKKEFNQIEGCV